MISKEIKFLLGHSSIYGLGTVVAKIVAFILLPIYTRYLTPEDYGAIEIIDITTGTIGLVISLGIVRSMSRFYYEKKDIQYRNEVVSTTYLVYSAVAVLFSFVLFPITEIIGEIAFHSKEYGYYFTISFLAMLLGGLIDIGIMYLRLVKKSNIYIAFSLSRLCILFFLNILFIVYFKMGILGILYSSLITKTIFSFVITIAVISKIGLRYSNGLAKNLIKFSLPLVPANLLNWLVNKSDRYFILYFVSVGDTGIYSLAQKFGSVIHSFITHPFLMAYAPRRFELINKHPDNTANLLSKIFSYYTLLMVFVGLSLSILIPEILQLMITSKFYAAINLVPLIVLSMVIFGFRYHFEFGILYSKKTKYFVYINATTSFFNIVLNLLLIPHFGIWGAVFGSLSSIIIHAVLLYLVSNRLYPIPFEFQKVLKIFLLSFVFYVLSICIATDSMLISIGIKLYLIICFPLSLILLRVINDEEKEKLLSIVHNRIVLKIKGKVKRSPDI